MKIIDYSLNPLKNPDNWMMLIKPTPLKKPSAIEMERGFKHKIVQTRQIWSAVTRSGFSPSPLQIERGLTDKDLVVRKRWAQRPDYRPDPALITRIFSGKHGDCMVRLAMREDVTIDERMTKKLVSIKDTVWKDIEVSTGKEKDQIIRELIARQVTAEVIQEFELDTTDKTDTTGTRKPRML